MCSSFCQIIIIMKLVSSQVLVEMVRQKDITGGKAWEAGNGVAAKMP